MSLEMQRGLTRNPTTPSTGETTYLNQVDTYVAILFVLAPLCAAISVVLVIVAIMTNQWLHTEEKMNNPAYNGTGERDFLAKLTVSGLWTLCYTNPGELKFDCSRIDYFSKEEYSPDPNDSTMAIPYAVTRSMLFIIASSLLLCGGFFCSVLGHCAKHRRLCTFISGVFFIVSGLIMLFGLVMYISIFKAEIGSKLRPRSQLQPPRFTYRYGYSFLMYVSGFVTTELAGISAVLLFIYRQQRDWFRKRLEDIRRGKIRAPSSVNYLHLDHSVFYPCRRHPQAYINSNSAIQLPARYPSPVHPRRYYFNKEPLQESPCSIHRVNANKPIPQRFGAGSEFYDFPPPPTISYQFDGPVQERDFSRDNSIHFPRDMTSNTVSTTADVNCEVEFTPERFDDYSPHEHEFVTFDLDAPLPLRAQSTASIASTGTVRPNRKDAATDTLRRTTPV